MTTVASVWESIRLVTQGLGSMFLCFLNDAKTPWLKTSGCTLLKSAAD